MDASSPQYPWPQAMAGRGWNAMTAATTSALPSLSLLPPASSKPTLASANRRLSPQSHPAAAAAGSPLLPQADGTLPRLLQRGPAHSPTGASPATRMVAAAAATEDDKLVQQLVLNLFDPVLREDALAVLSKEIRAAIAAPCCRGCDKKVKFQQLAPLLWNSFGVITMLLQEIIAVYRYISPPTLSHAQSNRLCNALALLQCVATHPETSSLLIDANIPIYLYPFLNTTCRDKPFEYVRLTSLGVIGALVKLDKKTIITYLINSEVVPLCLRSMEVGSELSKTVATFIIQKIIMDEIGLEYICETADRFFALGRVLGSMVVHLVEHPSQSPRLLKHIIRCYLRLSEDSRGAINLRSCIPAVLQVGTLNQHLNDDSTTQEWLEQLLQNIDMATCHAISQLELDQMTRK